MPSLWSSILRRSAWTICLTGILTLVCLFTIRKLQFDTSPSTLILAGSSEARYYEEIKRIFGNDQLILIGIQGDNLLRPSELARVRDLTNELERIPGVKRVLSLTNVKDVRGVGDEVVVSPLVPEEESPTALQDLRGRIRNNPFYVKNLISSDERTLAVLVFLDEFEQKESLLQGREVTRQVRAISQRVLGEGQAFVSGLPEMELQGTENMIRDLRVLTPLTLLLVTSFSGKRALPAGSWKSAGILFLYAIPFSFAYTRLSASAGALILFGVVQLTMITAGLWSGERPRLLQWLGLGTSIVGLVYLLMPGIGTPSLPGATLMSIAGFSWGVYSLRGRGAASPLAQTTSNFVRSVPLILSVSLLTIPQIHIEGIGALFAVMSGVVASGAGYVIWYSALRGLTATRAAVVQLAVPILAAGGGVAFLGENVSPRLAIASAMVLGGIALALWGQTPRSPK